MGKSIYEILKLNPNNPEEWSEIETEYLPVDIEKITIGANTYTNYGAYWFFWEKTYVKSPSRSGNGSMPNINNISTFLTGHLVIDFSLISIDDYRSIMRTHYEQNEVIVQCYDTIYNRKISLKMYFATEERKKLYIINKSRLNGNTWEEFLMLAGVQDYQLEMIGTNNSLDTITVTYNLNAPAGVGVYDTVIGSVDIPKGGDFICGQDADYEVKEETFDDRYRFVCWQDINGYKYSDGYAYTANDNMVLYAVWESVEQKTLSYSYGLSAPMLDGQNPVYERQVKFGQSIGALPTFEQTPAVVIDEITYYPYENGAWYKTPTKAINSVPLADNELYWLETSTQIYLIYETKKYRAHYYIDGEFYVQSDTEYNTAVLKPQPFKAGYTLSGWYLDADYKTPAPVLMPPYNINLYAKWNKD